MTKAEVRRKSRASGSTGDHFDRKLSTYSAAPNHLFRDRRRSTMFENSALVGPRRGSSPSISWNKLQTPRQSNLLHVGMQLSQIPHMYLLSPHFLPRLQQD